MVEPRIFSAPSSISSLGREAVELGASAGVFLDDWQASALDVGMGLNEAAKWSSFEVAVNTARQNGKNEIALVRELAGLFLLNERLVIHSAHEFKTSSEHQLRVEEIVQDTPDLHKRVRARGGYKHAHGEEGIYLKSGQRIRFLTRTKGAGRGHTGDLVVLDEAMILALAIMGALMPTMSARSITGNPQLWYFFTAVDQMINDHGLVAARLRGRGVKGDDPSLAYLEWSADCDDLAAVDDELLDDRAAWLQANPALGIRISENHIEKELRSMDSRTFAVERLGIGDWPDVLALANGVIDLTIWNGLRDTESAALDPVCLSVDKSPDGRVSIGAAGRRADGLLHIEVIENRTGTRWVAERLVELVEKHAPKCVVCADHGPVKSLVPEIEEAGVQLEKLSGAEHADACMTLMDKLHERGVRHLNDSVLTSAVKGAVNRSVGDSWLWSRKNSSVDISPLVAVTLALYGFLNIEGYSEPMVAFG